MDRRMGVGVGGGGWGGGVDGLINGLVCISFSSNSNTKPVYYFKRLSTELP